MEDILTLDQEMMGSLGQIHPKRIPSMCWIRLRHRISPYLTRVQCEEVLVLNWRHCAFVKVARERYLCDDVVWRAMHSLLADYWYGCGDDVMVARQPLTFNE